MVDIGKGILMYTLSTLQGGRGVLQECSREGVGGGGVMDPHNGRGKKGDSRGYSRDVVGRKREGTSITPKDIL